VLSACGECQALKSTALQAAKKLIVLKGHGFSRAVSATKQWRALAPEGSF
jgi:hypothetical protein